MVEASALALAMRGQAAALLACAARVEAGAETFGELRGIVEALQAALAAGAPPAAAIRVEPTDDLLSRVSGVLIDLDGTIYTPSGLIDGADDLWSYIIRRKLPYCFVSNTGAKGASGVRKKLANADGAFALRHKPVPTRSIVTAAEATIEYLASRVAPGAKLFVIAGDERSNKKKAAPRPRSASIGGDGAHEMARRAAQPGRGGVGAAPPFQEGDGGESWWMTALRAAVPAETLASWDVRTYLSERESRRWAALSLHHDVLVVIFSDGEICNHFDPMTGERGFADWSFDMVKKASYLLAHGAKLVVTAEDAFNTAHDEAYPGHVFPLPGPGMFAAAFRKLMYPLGEKNIVVIGKGGESCCMIEKALEVLQEQGCDTSDRSKILIIGDRFDTDVAAGVLSGLSTCLVESGAHDISLQRFYPNFATDFVCASVAALLPLSSRATPRQTPRAALRHRRVASGANDSARADAAQVLFPAMVEREEAKLLPHRGDAAPPPPPPAVREARNVRSLEDMPDFSATGLLKRGMPPRASSVELLFPEAPEPVVEEPTALVVWTLARTSRSACSPTSRYRPRQREPSLTRLLADFFYQYQRSGLIAPRHAAAAFAALGIDGVRCRPENARCWPRGAVADDPLSDDAASERPSDIPSDDGASPRRQGLTLAQFIAAVRCRLADGRGDGRDDGAPAAAAMKPAAEDVDDGWKPDWTTTRLRKSWTPMLSSSNPDWMLSVSPPSPAARHVPAFDWLAQSPPPELRASSLTAPTLPQEVAGLRRSLSTQKSPRRGRKSESAAASPLAAQYGNSKSHGDLQSLRVPSAEDLAETLPPRAASRNFLL
ncbi:HAD-like domain-containing protein [Pelagophyceae sp. CCMP2097]|nr:HAD-like domain-containing protein [Pelagophyceae sp. CCMP2097]